MFRGASPGRGLPAVGRVWGLVAHTRPPAISPGPPRGADPYRRKTVTFDSELDRLTGAARVTVKHTGVDTTPFLIEHDPGNPAADADGNVKLPNVNVLIEMADMREANRSYEANLQMVKQARSMTTMTLDLLRNS